MTKWEYVVLECNSSLKVERMNGMPIEQIEADKAGFLGGRGKRQPYLYEYLAEVGKQGWEVCGTSPYLTGMDGGIVRVQVILKRSLEE